MLYTPTVILAIIQLYLSGLLLRQYSASKKNTQVITLFFITLSLTFWTIANTILLRNVYTSSGNLLFNITNPIAFFLGSISIVQIYNFSYFFPLIQKRGPKEKLFIIFSSFLPFLTIFPQVTGKSELVANTHSYLYTSGKYGIFYIVLVAFYILLFIKRSIQSSKLAPEKIRQVKTVAYSLALAAFHAVIFIILLPIRFGESDIIYVIGYLAPSYFVIATTYSLLRQQLFDVRAAVARATTYILILTTVVLTYGVMIFGVSGVFFNSTSIPFVLKIVYLISGIVLAFTFQPLKRFFDIYTNKIFYRDSYDTQHFLEELNKILVSTIDLKMLVQKTIETIEINLKSEFTVFFLNDTPYVSQRFIGSTSNLFTDEEFRQVVKLVSALHQKIVVTDTLTEDSKNTTLYNALQAKNIAIVSRLVTNSKSRIEGSGYILFGIKKSGNPYNTQDIGTIEIITNQLVIAIQNALRFEEIKNFNITLQKEVDDATRKLRRANDKLKALDESKDDFISMASHQLRTPLTSIKGYISMVLEGDAGKVSTLQHEMLGQAFFSSQRMVYLISDLLNISRLKTGKFVIERGKVNLATMVAQELDQLKETASARQLTLNHEAPDNFPDLMLDETKTRQVIMNFVDNAIYYTPAGGHINVKLIDNPNSVELRVEDDGIGVSKTDQPHLFTKFYRAGNARKARPDGTGLGLFMAKKVIIAEEGSLIFDSIEGKGSTFGFIFYKSKAGVTK